MTLEYITTRELEGKTAGRIRIVKMKEDDFAQIDFTCPECGKNAKMKEKWTEPFVQGEGANEKFFVACSGCKNTQKLLKLKKEVKKKK
jgi:ssDNA-binding Zn-finger/Zn-ribbon topoisomerase 1